MDLQRVMSQLKDLRHVLHKEKMPPEQELMDMVANGQDGDVRRAQQRLGRGLAPLRGTGLGMGVGRWRVTAGGSADTHPGIWSHPDCEVWYSGQHGE